MAQIVSIDTTIAQKFSAAIDRVFDLNTANLNSKFVLTDLELERDLCVKSGDKHGAGRMERAITCQKRVIDYLDSLEKSGVMQKVGR